MWNYRDQNFRVGYRGDFEMITLKYVEVALEKDSIQLVIEEMSRGVVGLDQAQGWVLIEIGYNLLNVGSMIICQRPSKYIR